MYRVLCFPFHSSLPASLMQPGHCYRHLRGGSVFIGTDNNVET